MTYLDPLREKAIQHALDWISDYATHLRLAIPTFSEGGPDADWMARCQELDETLRDIDTEILKAATETADGASRFRSLRVVQADFEGAMVARRNELIDLLGDARHRRRTIRGYSMAEEAKAQALSALYFERNI
ncbi:MAG TPA: hypothetical protein DIU15_04140 [Deltaproteobacteria bacterium]|nr:hypothetical protein [Deltaproteobacteria bacterium]HCP45204.1 hypothetical protein [Deltaproteobacteria bacterium]